jgi:membrane-associated protease RseP (regulator of RpoE activity)
MRYAAAVSSAARAARSSRGWLHLGLFAATCATTFLAGATMAGGFDPGRGVAFGGTLMFVLACHELGHFVIARRRGIPASLPYFIPLPPGVSLGTMGAVIHMERPIEDPDHLVEVGAAGPLAGLVVAVPLLALGLALSPVIVPQGGVVEGNSLLYAGLKLAIHGRLLPAADGADVDLHPIGFAAWVGLLITFINLIPIGQLDGGHVARGLLGDRHERLSARLHVALIAIGGLVTLGWTIGARRAGIEGLGALGFGVQAALPWWMWAVMLAVLRRASGGVYHPPTGSRPLAPARRRLVALVAIVFVLIFTPVPMREVLVPLFAGGAP